MNPPRAIGENFVVVSERWIVHGRRPWNTQRKIQAKQFVFERKKNLRINCGERGHKKWTFFFSD